MASKKSRSGSRIAARGRGRGVLVSNDPVERAVAEIRHLARKAALDLALEVGEIVFRRVFAGDMEMVREQGPKHSSFRRLALHSELPMSAAGLWRAVTMYELWQRMPRLGRYRHIGAGHLHAVLGLPARDQERLLTRAERERLNPADLRVQAAARRKGAGGRPPKPEIVKALDQLRRVAVVPVSTFTDTSTIHRLDEEEVEVALATLDEIEERVEALRATLREVANLGW